MNGQTEDHSPLAKAVDELEHIKGRRLPLAWAQLARLNAIKVAAEGMAAEIILATIQGHNQRLVAALAAYEKAVNA